MSRKIYWRICCGAIFVLAALTYSPIVLSEGPALGPIPNTLAWGFGIALMCILLTFIGTRVHPVNEEE